MDKKDFLGKFRNLFSKISPQLHVGGIQITDFAVRYAGVKSGGFIRESLRLPPGVVENGKIKNKDALAAVLAELRIRVYPDLKKPLSAVLTLPIRDVYIQTFSVPQITEGDFEEAAELNAKMISPINVENAYYGWQKITEDISASVDIDMLGAFVQKQIVDDFMEVIEFSGFGIAAVEFESMSLVRSISRAKLADNIRPYVAMQIGVEGINLVVVRKGVPHFHYFHSWLEVQGEGKSIPMDSFKNALKDELERVINFYLTHWSGEQIDDIVVVTPEFSDEILKLIKEEFDSLKVQATDPSKVSAVLGAAWRGTIQRFADAEISLSSVSARGVFERQQSWNFIRIWRNIFVTSIGFLLLLFVVSNIFLRTELDKLAQEEKLLLSDPNAGEYQSLAERAEEFNDLVGVLAGVKAGGIDASSLLLKINSITGPSVKLTKIEYNPSGATVSVNGIAASESFAVEFKNKIEGVPQFHAVSLPLQNIFPEGERVTFNLSFQVSSFDFAE